jgi:hypothetical protein
LPPPFDGLAQPDFGDLMASTLPDDILLPAAAPVAGPRPPRSRLTAFVPIALALLGIVAILFGRVTVQEISANDVPAAVDPVTTGSIGTALPMKADGSPGAR